METLHKILQESVSGGFWTFVGYYLILYLVAKICYQLLFYIGKALFLITMHCLGILSNAKNPSQVARAKHTYNS